MIKLPDNPLALALVPLALATTLLLWRRLARRDRRLLLVYLAGLLGALVGAKLAFLFAEGWRFRDNPVALLTGRSITGALLGGYLLVELAKRAVGYASATGDLFALVVPVGLSIGRVNCIAQGCCPGHAHDHAHWWTVTDSAGVHRWPAAHAELAFNAALLAWASSPPASTGSAGTASTSTSSPTASSASPTSSPVTTRPSRDPSAGTTSWRCCWSGWERGGTPCVEGKR